MPDRPPALKIGMVRHDTLCSFLTIVASQMIQRKKHQDGAFQFREPQGNRRMPRLRRHENLSLMCCR